MGNNNDLSSVFRPNAGKSDNEQKASTPVRLTGDFAADTEALRSRRDSFGAMEMSVIANRMKAEDAYKKAEATKSFLDISTAQRAAEDYAARDKQYRDAISGYNSTAQQYNNLYRNAIALMDGDYSTATARDAEALRKEAEGRLTKARAKLAESTSGAMDRAEKTRWLFTPADQSAADLGVLSRAKSSKGVGEAQKKVDELQALVDYYRNLYDAMSAPGFEESRKDWLGKNRTLEGEYAGYVKSKKAAGTYSYANERAELEQKIRGLREQARATIRSPGDRRLPSR